MNVFSRLANVFVSPDACFASIRDKGTKWTDYVVPVLLLVAMVVVFMVATSDLMEKVQADTIRKMTNIPEAQKEAAIQQTNSPLAVTIKYVISILSVAISALAGALIMWVLGNFVGGGQQKYGVLLASAFYIQLISIPESIIKLVLMLQKEAMNVYIGLGSLFASPDPGSFGFQFAAQFEFFKLWRIVLWIIAFKVLYKFSAKKSALLVVVTMLIGMVLSALLAGMQMGRMG